MKAAVVPAVSGTWGVKAKGKVTAIVEAYPLAEAPKAYQRVVDGKARFRAVLTM